MVRAVNYNCFLKNFFLFKIILKLYLFYFLNFIFNINVSH
jgi:hypothetical protein